MLTVSASRLRNNLFDYLDIAAAGETIVIQRNNQEVARIVPIKQPEWRDQLSVETKLLVSPDELMEPVEDIWEGYI